MAMTWGGLRMRWQTDLPRGSKIGPATGMASSDPKQRGGPLVLVLYRYCCFPAFVDS